ncbi:hypothetical protein J0895_00355 [Phormidium pseudopriestleyi FRX01]|uniref:Uncharacterized protein n=1 Tax=Phormidium pseudopriestleyi FRX01 TaxID=1759528 RepID=A0ABS3FKD9_9CYAN|nr:hypothetical protein [Phormidium pseudopriestleyi]MBO0347584.1 hypothetical protein [Phormidium pseudopriestleyi FRX01]
MVVNVANARKTLDNLGVKAIASVIQPAFPAIDNPSPFTLSPTLWPIALL